MIKNLTVKFLCTYKTIGQRAFAGRIILFPGGIDDKWICVTSVERKGSSICRQRRAVAMIDRILSSSHTHIQRTSRFIIFGDLIVILNKTGY